MRPSVADPVTDAKAVKSVVEKFREKHAAKDVRKYYSKFHVAVVELVQLPVQSCGLVLNRATNRKALAVRIS